MVYKQESSNFWTAMSMVYYIYKFLQLVAIKKNSFSLSGNCWDQIRIQQILNLCTEQHTNRMALTWAFKNMVKHTNPIKNWQIFCQIFHKSFSIADSKFTLWHKLLQILFFPICQSQIILSFYRLNVTWNIAENTICTRACSVMCPWAQQLQWKQEVCICQELECLSYCPSPQSNCYYFLKVLKCQPQTSR